MKLKIDKKGVTAMEALISIGLVAIIVMAVYSSLTGAMSNVNESKMRTGALALANEKMEIIRNLPYNEIGTIGGIISGSLYQTEQVQKNNYTFNVRTEVRYLDDGADGFFPDDLNNNDYKQVHIEADWGIPEKAVSIYSVFVPDGIEPNIGCGTLSINVLDSHGNVVPGVSVNIQSLDDDPVVDYSTGTDDLGGLVLPGVPSQNYRIYLSKSGYEDVRTYPNPPGSNFTPINSDIFVVETFLTGKTFFMDETADLTFKAIDIETDQGISGIDFSIMGGKKIGIDPDTFNTDRTEATDSSGNAVFSGISPGSYEIKNLEELDTSDYVFVGMGEQPPIELSSGEIREIEFLFANADNDSLLVTVKNEATGESLSGASVQLTGEGFDQTISTGDEGTAFFPQAPDVLPAGSYSLSVSLDGFLSYDGTIDINNLTEKEVTLTPQ